MSATSSTHVTPHRMAVDLAPLQGHTVLGEPLDVLFSAMLRLRIAHQGNGMSTLSGTLPNHEVDAIQRAMSRSEKPIPGDRRTAEQRDCDRLVAVLGRVGEVCHAVVTRGDGSVQR